MAADGDGGKGGGRRHAACREVSIRSESESASFEQVFWRAEKKTGVIQDHKPPKLPVSKKTAQSDVTAKTALKSALKKHSEFQSGEISHHTGKVTRYGC